MDGLVQFLSFTAGNQLFHLNHTKRQNILVIFKDSLNFRRLWLQSETVQVDRNKPGVFMSQILKHTLT